MVKEAQLKAVVKGSYKRKKAFKRLTEAEQDAAGRQLMHTGDSAAAFFDLNALRKTSKRRGTQVTLKTENLPAATCQTFVLVQMPSDVTECRSSWTMALFCRLLETMLLL